MMKTPTAAMLVIGDEILSGRTRDANMHHLAQVLTSAGIDLKEVRIVSDEAPAIIDAVNALRKSHSHVITSGGIGPTHDDITADSIASAFGVGIDVRDDAKAILQERYDRMGVELNEARLRMARIPDGATLIENPVSGAPGFTLENVHVMAGVPAVFQAMVAQIIPLLDGGPPVLSQTIRVEKPEGELAGALGDIARVHPDVSIGSYPFIENGAYGSNIVVRGRDGKAVGQAIQAVAQIFGITT
jgi:molybdenum cofactor synthesis domain-containing protein